MLICSLWRPVEQLMWQPALPVAMEQLHYLLVNPSVCKSSCAA